MTYTSPSPANIALNGNLTTWWIPATNLSTITATGVTVSIVVSPAGGLKLETWSTDTGSFNSTTKIWNVGTLVAGQTKWLKLVTKVIDIGLAPFTMTSIISGNGIDPNNANNTLEQTLTSVVTTVTAGAIADESCSCGDVSLNDIPCNYGITEWRLTSPTVPNSTVYTWDVTTGKYKFIHDNPFLDIVTSYSIWCDSGTGFVEISGPVTLTISKLFDDLTIWNHTSGTKLGTDLTLNEILILQTQSEYASLTEEQIRAYCWNTLLNSSGVLVGGWAMDCNEKQDTRTFFECSETECEDIPNPCPSCPQGTLPLDVADAIAAYVDYVPQIGDAIYVKHTNAYTIHKWDGTQWVKWDCGCVVDQDTTYALSIDGTTLTLTPSTGAPQIVELPTNGDGITVQDTCDINLNLSGTNVLTATLLGGSPVPYYAPTLEAPGSSGTIADVSTLFSEACPVGCTPTYTIAGYPTTVFENVVLTGLELTYDIKVDAPGGGTHFIEIKRECNQL